ncbi:MAG: GHMP kinase [Proteobacteria bacterium]|nr:GHMP kinase [Pseudomonadota bacterium]MBU1389458.1 GHMP kinase [Pseudomonadota bacterium]MBU1541278.1 GHMP kinase [Pseudomonadota bacterium]MBU2429322.1 GHMP kinase [Pseudomonadota bacterium]
MIISRTPMRMSFAGGGSDLSVYYKTGYGLVISTAINKYIYITVNKKFDDLIRVSYSSTEVVDSVDKIKHNIIREAIKLVGIENGIEVVYMGDVPLGSAGIGLGSSSSLAVGVLNALYAYKGMHVSAEKLAREACEIEIDILGHPIGKQDQYAAAYGGLNSIQFNLDESVYVDPVICGKETKDEIQKRLLVFYTGIERFSTDILCDQKKEIDNNKNYLKDMVRIAEDMKNALVNKNIDSFGEFLNQGWELKKKLTAKISNTKIDQYYKKAIAEGAIGGKVMGAGGGGFLLFYAHEEKHDNIRRALGELKENKIEFEPQGSKIIYVSE